MQTFSRIFACALLLVASHVMFGQSGPSVNKALDFWVTNAEREIVSAAAAMPEQKYNFAPTGGEFSGVRTFGEQVKHLAANNYRMAAYVLERKPSPEEEDETGPEAVRSKDEILNYLRGSFTALHSAIATITRENMLEPVSSHQPPRQNTRLQFAVDAVAHSYDHYGQMVEYLRMNGIVPPASRK
jgi:hypothetical protein